MKNSKAVTEEHSIPMTGPFSCATSPSPIHETVLTTVKTKPKNPHTSYLNYNGEGQINQPATTTYLEANQFVLRRI